MFVIWWILIGFRWKYATLNLCHAILFFVDLEVMLKLLGEQG